jgi:phosphoribosylformimino-5-aminoimidazole carboxamide ribotide isomerase
MPILPVLDLKQGQVVRGIAGRREEYRPIVSKLTSSTCPRDVAKVFRDYFGFGELYLADLDAIAGATPALKLFEDLSADGFRLWVDAGVQKVDDAVAVFMRGVASVVIGLETLPGPRTLDKILVELNDPRSVVFSLDLKHGQPLGGLGPWHADNPWAIAQRAFEAGVERILVLDLAHVGIGAGTGTEALCARLRKEHPRREISTGGGVRGPEDVSQLYACGVNYVLVASALHDGRLSPADVAALQQ